MVPDNTHSGVINKDFCTQLNYIRDMHPIIVIYHASCPDGFAASLAAHLYFLKQGQSNVQHYPAQHGKIPPDCKNKEVYILDFSYDRQTMLDIADKAKQVTIIDHHISAQKELEKIDQEKDNIRVIFDMTHSGAILSWDFFHQSDAPKLFKIIEDRDIWKFEFSQTNDIMSAVVSHPMDYDLWQTWIEDESLLNDLEKEGKILGRERDKLIKKYQKRARIEEISGYQIPIVNAPSSIASDLLQILSDGYPFAASYEDREDRRIWQLRSSGEKQIDVSQVAQGYGGGGHKNASGFATSLNTIKI